MTTPAEPLVSVLMPVRNEQDHVAAAIRSVLAQSLRDLELLVIDGASEDATADEVRRLAEQDSRVQLLENPGRTIPRALNVGRRAARGRYVARVDAHARVDDGYLQSAVTQLESAPDVAAVGGIRIGVAATPAGRAIAAALSSRFGVGGSVNHYGTRPQDSDHASFGVYRKDLLAAVEGWDERLPVNEDVDIDHRLLGLGYRIRFDPQMQIFWQVRESLRDFGRQYRRYGRGKAGMVRKNGASAVRGRHLVAPALVTALGAGAALAVAGHPLPLVCVTAAYACGVVGAAASVRGRSHREPHPVDVRALAASFVVMHLTWGLGFLEGMVGLQPVHSSAR